MAKHLSGIKHFSSRDSIHHGVQNGTTTGQSRLQVVHHASQHHCRKHRCRLSLSLSLRIRVWPRDVTHTSVCVIRFYM